MVIVIFRLQLYMFELGGGSTLKKLATSVLFIVSLLFMLCSCSTVGNEPKNKETVRKAVKEFSSEIKLLNFEDEEIQEWHELAKGFVSNNEVSKGIYRHLNKIINEIGIVKEGNVVIDLGSWVGIDCILLRQIVVGDDGKVIGVDINEPVNVLARKYSEHFGYDNVEFILGDIRELPIDDNTADVVISKNTLSFVAEKEKVFSEIFRVLKCGGVCYINDIIVWEKNFDLIDNLKNDAWYDDNHTINRSIREEGYLEILERIGFKNIKIEIRRLGIISDKGKFLWHRTWIHRFRYRNKFVAAHAFIYAEKKNIENIK